MTKRYSIALTISLALMAASIIAIAASAHGSNQPRITGTNWFPLVACRNVSLPT
jgi:hypothetical protein